MYRIAEGDSRGLLDVEKFIDLLNDPSDEVREFFDDQNNILIARAPGRLDVMGGIADYSGSLVLEMPIAEATIAAVQKRDDQNVVVRSLSFTDRHYAQFEIQLTDLFGASYENLRAIFAADKANHWASYVGGVFSVLAQECGFEFQNGLRILIASDVPTGKGVSSSAALEVATMQAICAAFGFQLGSRQLALLCQKVENLIVGAPCGVMDQMTSNCGAENSLMSLLCQPAEIKEIVKIPESIAFWGIDSGVRHAITGSRYSTVRTAAFMGYRMIAEIAGFKVREVSDGVVEIDDRHWNGYLCNVLRDEYERSYAPEIPETLTGSMFIEKYGGITDTVTSIDRSQTYPVKAATGFPIYENERAARFADILKSDEVLEHLDELGELMLVSHAGYAACRLTEPGTDRIVELVRQNRDKGLFGARITGGGSGGTVAVLGIPKAEEAVIDIAERCSRETGRRSNIFSGSSPGCAAFEFLTLSAA